VFLQVGLGDREDSGPAPKISRPSINRESHLSDPNSSDHVVAITELREQIATMQKQLNAKDQQLLAKEKQVIPIRNFVFLHDSDLVTYLEKN